MYNSNMNFKIHYDIFAKEAFSKREAWNWLIANVREEKSQYRVKSSLRILAKSWQWPKTKVARFLKELTSANLIETENSSSSTMIKITSTTRAQFIEIAIGTETETVNDTAQPQEVQTIQENVGAISGTENGTGSQNIVSNTFKMNQSGQKWDNSGTEFGTVNDTVKLERIHCIEKNAETASGTEIGTIPGQYRDSDGFSEVKKEEKKKRNKKRKEENTKEKYSLKGIQKERYEDFETGKESNQENSQDSNCQSSESLLTEKGLLSTFKPNAVVLSKKPPRRTMDQVEVSDVATWAEENLPAEINLEWELAKFQDYYRAGARNLPRDGVAAFRNWLRKATEFKNLRVGEGSNERHKAYNSSLRREKFKESTGFERFIAGGLRAVS